MIRLSTALMSHSSYGATSRVSDKCNLNAALRAPSRSSGVERDKTSRIKTSRSSKKEDMLFEDKILQVAPRH